MSKNQCRKWFCRCSKKNNTQNGLYEYDFDELYQTLCEKYDSILFAIHDKDETNVHCHIVIQNKTGIKFDTLVNLMPYGDIQKQRGSNKECYEYCLHIDEKSKETEKIQYDDSCIKTNIDDLEEWKKVINVPGARNDLLEIYSMIQNGASDYEIMQKFPTQFILYGKAIREARQSYLRDAHSNEFRNLEVTYIYGSTGVGKTRYVMEKYGYKNVYRVTDYGTGAFDGYNGQDVILFDEFRSSIKVANMLTYLDGYPVELPCRFANKPALFTKVYIISNIPLYDQYEGVQKQEPQTYEAFCRRIKEVYNFDRSKDTPIDINSATTKMLMAIDINKDELPW